MPYDDPDPTDPMTLTGVELAVNDPGAAREMAACFIEEFVRVGHGAAAIREIFASGQYAGPSLAARQLGLDEIDRLIDEQVLLRGPRGLRTAVDQLPGGSLSLPVLER